MNWSSFRDAREGPISRTYNINGWPTIYVLDRKGVIGYRGLYHGGQVAKGITQLRLKRPDKPIFVAHHPKIKRPDVAAKFQVARAPVNKCEG